MSSMSDESIPKPASSGEQRSQETPKIKIGGLGPKAARLQALREKMAHQKNGGKQHFDGSGNNAAKAKSSFTGGKKPNFNRKAV